MIRNNLASCFLRHPLTMDIIKNIFSIKPLVNSRLYKNYTLKKARQHAQSYPHGTKRVQIETTLNCNARCVMCYHSVKQLSGTMDMSLFKKIIDDCHDNKINSIGLSIYGEPLMDKYLFERIQYLRNYGMTYGFFTNGYLLDVQKANRLFELGGLSRINFSLGGYEPQVYEKIMVGLKRDTTYQNILNFLRLKERYERDNLIVSISTVKLNLNREDKGKFIKFWREQRGVNYIITANLWNRIGDKDVNVIANFGKIPTKDIWLTPCKQLWGCVYIYFDGKVAPCCGDNDLRKLIVGDINRQTLQEIYTGKTIEKLRKLHLEDRRDHHETCGKCFHNSVWI